MKELKEYANLVEEMSIFEPGLYPLIGLADEILELFLGSKDDEIGELGDIIFYIFAAHKYVYGRYPNIIPDPFLRSGSAKYDLVRGASGLLSLIKKSLRGDYDHLDDIQIFGLTIMDIYQSWVSTCYKLDHEPLKVMKKNTEKLLSRRERGVIQGEGNNR